MNKLCILIPVYNKLEYTRKCLADLKENINGSLADSVQIVVIDDGSQDGTGNWIHDHFPEVIVLKGTGNLFWTGAMNLGIKYAIYEHGYEYILLWNNDVKTGEEYFRYLIHAMQAELKGIVGSKILTLQDKNRVWSFGGYFNPQTGDKGMIGYFDTDKEEYSKIRSVDWCTGMGTLVHKDVVKKIGLMEEKLFPQYFGDTDYSYRAKLAGFPVRVNPEMILFNDTTNTGLRAQNGLGDLLKSLVDIRSNINLKSNFSFLRRYATSKKAYISLCMFYFRVFGGFFKWKFLSLFNLRRTSERYYQNKAE
jgi:GT2 family glycosyltransferase